MYRIFSAHACIWLPFRSNIGGCSNVDKESKAHDDVVALSGPELGMTTTVGQGQEKAAARRTRHAEDGELLEDISFVESDLENPGKLQVRVLYPIRVVAETSLHVGPSSCPVPMAFEVVVRNSSRR